MKAKRKIGKYYVLRTMDRKYVDCARCNTEVRTPPQRCSNCKVELCRDCWKFSFKFFGVHTDEDDNLITPLIQFCHICKPLNRTPSRTIEKPKMAYSH